MVVCSWPLPYMGTSNPFGKPSNIHKNEGEWPSDLHRLLYFEGFNKVVGQCLNHLISQSTKF